ncbi:SAM-dependent methyltransferase [Loktanella agnita]|uniref:SAM-dependent methyltransferase n=1 Tax=Loktanella agnita TaxID=287097 RepID=UPI0039867A18
MKSFPMFIKMSGRRVVIIGGGEQAAQKARLMLKTEASIIIAAPALDDELGALVATGRATHHTGAITPTLFQDSALVLVGSGCPAIDRCAHDLAKRAGAVVNVVDQPVLCDVTTPSIVDRDPVVIAIGTEGTAPVLARALKTEIEQMLDPRLGSFAALAGRLRDVVAHKIAREDRRAFWRWVFKDAPWLAFKRGAEREAAALIKSALDTGTQDCGAIISLVGAGPGDRDLLTLRAVERLQEADVIFYDHDVNPDTLELARRDAERICLGAGANPAPFSLDRLLIAQARQGRRVVHLSAPDPRLCQSAKTTLAAAHAADVATEVIPGIAAAPSRELLHKTG